MAIKHSATLRNAQADAVTTAVGNAGLLRIYSGTRPANVAAAITGTLLAEVTLGSPFAPGAAAGVLSPTVPQSDVSADSTGTATHYRLWKSDGTTAVQDGDVSTSGADMNLNTVSLVATGVFTITGWTHTIGNA